MNSVEDPGDRLALLVDRALKTQPPQHAPADLAERVWAELGRRAALPWWRRGFSYWPTGARLALLALLAALVGVVYVVGGSASTGMEGALRSGVGSLAGGLPGALRAVTVAFQELFQAGARAVPSAWLYGVAAAVASLYVTGFGLGAAAYRLLRGRG